MLQRCANGILIPYARPGNETFPAVFVHCSSCISSCSKDCFDSHFCNAFVCSASMPSTRGSNELKHVSLSFLSISSQMCIAFCSKNKNEWQTLCYTRWSCDTKWSCPEITKDPPTCGLGACWVVWSFGTMYLTIISDFQENAWVNDEWDGRYDTFVKS